MSDEDYLRAMELQRKNFEAQFGSIETLGFQDKIKEKQEELKNEELGRDEEGENSEESEMESSEESEEFEGFDSEDGNQDTNHKQVRREVPPPKVVRLSDSYTGKQHGISKKDKKLLSSGRVASLVEEAHNEAIKSKMTKKQQKAAAQEDAENLDNDLKLQRLLQESHILAGSTEASGAELTLQTIDYEEPTGNARKRTLESRIRTLASANSATGGLPKKLEKMPMSMRKGMIKSHEEKIKRYEEEAKNAGIVLHKVKKGERRQLDAKGSSLITDRIGTGKKKQHTIRDRGLKISSIGRSTRNGLLISKDEIERISNQGKRRNAGGKKRGKR